jgi:hypothetical protein
MDTAKERYWIAVDITWHTTPLDDKFRLLEREREKKKQNALYSYNLLCLSNKYGNFTLNQVTNLLLKYCHKTLA